MISIISPVFNCASYIRPFINSVLAQSFQDWQLILVDDGSNDSSGKICDEYSSFDQRINVIHKVNGGTSSARNAGIRIASGEYLYFADSDDELFPDALSTLMALMHSDVDLVTASYERYEEGVLIRERIHKDDFQSKPEVYLGIISELPNAHFCERYLWTKLFRKSIVDKYSILFCEDLCYREDVYFIFNYVTHCMNSIIGVNKKIYKYYRRSSGASANHTSSMTPHSVDRFLSTKLSLDLVKSCFVNSVAEKSLKKELLKDYYALVWMAIKSKVSNKDETIKELIKVCLRIFRLWSICY